MVNYGTGVSIHPEPGVHTHSKLTVPSAGFQNAGNYSCKASNTLPASVQVFVSEGMEILLVTFNITFLLSFYVNAGFF